MSSRVVGVRRPNADFRESRVDPEYGGFRCTLAETDLLLLSATGTERTGRSRFEATTAPTWPPSRSCAETEVSTFG
ncbi:hypothetical protein M0R88_08340 [Halorussus gelatinilyticus]|uniref:Uncharacterized protein n=1 Tax=Halorussus gelatinilyticus TaxID=2937524 RepID=A0A8U0INB2_9EURY|nr:hypothetical protein [Halorussus gelatinilyticus]UPW02091.1 hypothetical protein M0R88_08340 [Halorussus gelatinilyticus]